MRNESYRDRCYIILSSGEVIRFRIGLSGNTLIVSSKITRKTSHLSRLSAGLNYELPIRYLHALTASWHARAW